MQGMKIGKTLGALICIFVLWATIGSQVSHAELASDHAFDGAVWEQIQEQPRVAGVVQSLCCTEDYIIWIENYGDGSDENDIVSAFYKNNVDENGNPVEQYSLAKQVADTNYEHANGMAYNPNTGEILVSLYTSSIDGNRGCLYVMDAKTLTYKDKVKISDDYNILGIGYNPDTNQYIIQTNVDGGYSFKILDSNYQIIEDLGKYDGTAKGSNFQDLCVDGDYIINFPLTLHTGLGDYINQYSISRKALASDTQLNFNFTNVTADEPESICETAPGEFVVVVNTVLDDGSSTARLYKTTVPYNFHITGSAENGSLDNIPATVSGGDTQDVSYTPAKGYELASLTIDGKKADISKYQDGYSFADVRSDHTVAVSFSKMTIMGRISNFFTGLISPKKTPDTTVAKKIILISVLLLILLAGFALYVRIIYVRRLRILKKRRAIRERERAKQAYEDLEIGELEDIEMREYETL